MDVCFAGSFVVRSTRRETRVCRKDDRRMGSVSVSMNAEAWRGGGGGGASEEYGESVLNDLSSERIWPVVDASALPPWPAHVPRINTVSMVGHCYGSIDIRQTSVGKLAKFSLRVQRNYPASPGADWIKVVTFKYDAEMVEKFLRDGLKVFVRGYVSGNTWERDGRRYATWDIVANEVKLLDKGGSNQDYLPPEESYNSYSSYQAGGGERTGGGYNYNSSYSKPNSYVPPPPPRPPSSQSPSAVPPIYSPPPTPPPPSSYGNNSVGTPPTPNQSQDAWLNNSQRTTRPPPSTPPPPPPASATGGVPENIPDEDFARGLRGGKMPRVKGFSNIQNTKWGNLPPPAPSTIPAPTNSPPPSAPQGNTAQSGGTNPPDYNADELPSTSPF